LGCNNSNMKVIINDNLHGINIIYVLHHPLSMISETYQLIKRLDEYPVFTLDDFCMIVRKETPYCKVALNRMVKNGLVEKIQRDRYTTHSDPLVIATRLTTPSYISLWYALRFHDLTEQVPHGITVLTSSKRWTNELTFHGTTISFTRIKPKYLFGYSKVNIGGFEVFMADIEKAIFDSILLKKISFSEIIDIISSNRSRISFENLIDHSITAGNVPASKRLGWIIDRFGLPGSKELLTSVKGAVIPLAYSRPPSGKKDRKWGVIVNTEVGI
jgi:predicted transcriptional regulator of viral defense system